MPYPVPPELPPPFHSSPAAETSHRLKPFLPDSRIAATDGIPSSAIARSKVERFPLEATTEIASSPVLSLQQLESSSTALPLSKPVQTKLVQTKPVQTKPVQNMAEPNIHPASSQSKLAIQPIPPFKPAGVAQQSSLQKIAAQKIAPRKTAARKTVAQKASTATQKIAPSAGSDRSKITQKAATPIKSAIAPAKISAAQPAPLSYSISGVSGKLPQTAEATVMKQLDQAFVFDQLIEVYDAIGSLTARDLRRLAQRSPRPIIPGKTAQVSDVPNPLQSPTDILIAPGTPSTPPAPSLTPSGDNSATLNSVPLVDPLPTDQVPVSILRQIVRETATSPTVNPVEVTADRLDYDERNQVFTAEGNVIMRFRNGLVDADRVQVNLVNRIAVAEGNVAFTRGRQVLRGQRAELNFVQGVGNIQQARGDIYIPTAGTDISIPSATDGIAETVLGRPLSDRITSQQPLQNPGGAGGASISAGAGRDVTRVPGGLPRGGELKRLRFEAERIDFTPEGWVATNIQITNDPFSPPELVLKAEKATLTRLSPLQDEVKLTRPRLVFDQKFSLPFLFSRTVLDRRQRDAAPLRFAYDAQDRGGLYLEGVFNVLQSPKLSFTLYPQIFLQRMFDSRQSGFGLGDPSSYGLRTRLDAELSPSTFLRGSAALTSFDPAEFEDSLRASVRVRQILDTPIGPHTLALEYSYRDRLFNGSLGFQTVQSSIGLLLISPNILLGQSGVVLNYQVGYQSINSDTDRLNLLSATSPNNRVSLGRFQASVGASKTFSLWAGKPLPATRDQGLRFSANPIVPYVNFSTSLRGVYSNYTSGDVQQNLFAVAGLAGQFGHFSRDFLDYTAFNVSYSQAIGTGESPFLFDRVVDTRVISVSFIQQIYGPFRAGFSTAISLNTTGSISTDYFLEYSRRTYGVVLRYNPVLEIGSITLRISDFNWNGTADPFSGTGVTPVEGGVTRPLAF